METNVAPGHWVVELETGVKLCVRPTLEQMTTYVLLEQEDWFEDEIAFVRRLATRQTVALDVGANHGVYALSLAAAGAQRVWAFEPTRGAGEMLAQAIAENGFQDRVRWVPVGLSDTEREAVIATGLNTELSSLTGQGETSERVHLLTLDGFLAREAPGVPIDFVKLDVEGEERAVLAGGHDFFTSQSPVVMFELKHGGQVNEGLIDDFRRLGYGIYRLVPGAQALIPFDGGGADGFLLNLFAVKADTARRLAERNLLAEGDAIQGAFEGWGRRTPQPGTVLDRLGQKPWARRWGADWRARAAAVPALHWLALEACLAASDEKLPAAERVGALAFALEATAQLSGAPASDGAVWWLRLFALAGFGLRSAAVELGRQLLSVLAAGAEPGWPFLPPLAEYGERQPEPAAAWLAAGLQEFVLRRQSFSSYFALDQGLLDAALANPLHSPYVDRVALLFALRRKARPSIPPAHGVFDPVLSRNARLWRELVFGRVPHAVRALAGGVEIIDVGASSHGKLTEPYAPLMLLSLARVTGFEPDHDACVQLGELYKDQEAFRFLPHFVGRGGPATFHETNWFMTGSLYAPNVDLLQRFQGLAEVVRPVASHPVQTVALKDVPGIAGMDMLKIDVQGAELDVFVGAGALLEDALLIWTEVEFLPLYRDQPLFAEVERYLRDKGFQLFAFDGIASRPLRAFADSGRPAGTRTQALWADALFLPRLERWDDLATPRLAKLALLLDLVADAPDYCHYALTLIDRREGTDYAAAYVAK
jgi:FkbM family methyltransferase